MTPQQTALMERWNAFLSKIESRLGEIMAEAEQGLTQIWAQHPDDPMPMGNAMSGLDHRVRQLRDKIQETWDQQVEDKFSAAAFLDAGLDRKRDFEQSFDETWTMFKARAQTAFYRNLWPRAQQAMQKPVACTRCGAPIEPSVRHQAVSMTCPHCHTVNQILPDKAVSTYFMAGHAFGEEASLPLRFEIERFRIAVDRQRRAASWAPEPVESLDRWEQMERAYWQRYAEVKAQLTGERPDQAFVESRMEFFRKASLETDQRWRKAKGLS